MVKYYIINFYLRPPLGCIKPPLRQRLKKEECFLCDTPWKDNNPKFFSKSKLVYGGNDALLKYKGFRQKYKGKSDFPWFCNFRSILLITNYFTGHRSICLINSVPLIPILPYFMSFYAIWHLAWNAIKWHFMAFHAKCHRA